MANDMVVIMTRTPGYDPQLLLQAPALHFLPVPGCEGSPSRYQYLEGMPRDTRPGIVYDPRREAPIRAAYAEVQ